MEKSFVKGMNDAPKRFQQDIKQTIMSEVNINNEVSWTDWLYGRLATRPSKAERDAIEKVFFHYGISDPWGKE